MNVSFTRAGRWYAAAIACLAFGALPGCYPWVGPIRVHLETNGKAYDDVVVYPVLTLASIHAQDLERQEPRIVSSGEEIQLGPFLRSPRFDGIWLFFHHPRFHELWYAQSHYRGGPLELRLEMVPWKKIIERGHPEIGSVIQHLGILKTRYLPAFPKRERAHFQRYLPELRELVASARYVNEGRSPWKTEREARAEAEQRLAELSRATE